MPENHTTVSIWMLLKHDFPPFTPGPYPYPPRKPKWEKKELWTEQPLSISAASSAFNGARGNPSLGQYTK